MHHDSSASIPLGSGSDHAVEETTFSDIESLLKFITKQWKQLWVTTDIWNEGILESLLRRPSFILVSIDAPVSLRWKRLRDR